MTGIDRDAAAGAPLDGLAELKFADLENRPSPLTGRRFDAVVGTNYLCRLLMPNVMDSLAEGGVLIYETFAAGNEAVGKPSNPDFLLQPGELLRAARGLDIVAYEDGFLGPPPRFVQRIAAVKPRAGATVRSRHSLTPQPATPG